MTIHCAFSFADSDSCISVNTQNYIYVQMNFISQYERCYHLPQYLPFPYNHPVHTHIL